MVPAPQAEALVSADPAHHSPADIAAARERARARAAAMRVVLIDLETFTRTGTHALAGHVGQLIDAYRIAVAEANVYREMFGAIAYPRVGLEAVPNA